MTDEIPIEIRKLAWDWVVRMQSQTSTEEDTQELTNWLNENPVHMRAYTEYQEVAWSLDDLAALPESAAIFDCDSETTVPKTRPTKRLGLKEKIVARLGWLSIPQAGWALASFTVVAIMAIFILEPAPTVHRLDYQTQVGEIRSLTLADGSQVTVGADSHIESEISEADRYVRLLQGEAFFEIVKAAGVPFWVEIDDTVVQVVGTTFSINRSSQRIKVSVLEGVVRVAAAAPTVNDPSASEARHIELREGQQVLRTVGGEFGEIIALPTAEMESWRTGWLSYKSEPLIDVISDANRYFEGEIVIGENSLDKVLVTLSISTSDISMLPAMLTASLPLEVVKEGENRFVLMSKSSKQSN
ncbi:DUF4880 domain-containing protein [Pseudomaricurvus alcaniphilus]|uniref:FecR family protein n=1 Tax=Pseudomaricurvus alcaniphilus TaxID=1166482 RepID=UPI0014076E01|nr:FecR domain-containing protein [Pseudomaricurvus alcaniphilus]NHN35906.1 DUF4880 domain-containing protein [Pseudomaricurvus alcaniphilus]